LEGLHTPVQRPIFPICAVIKIFDRKIPERAGPYGPLEEMIDRLKGNDVRWLAKAVSSYMEPPNVGLFNWTGLTTNVRQIRERFDFSRQFFIPKVG
jgi:hypothetical protein